LEYKEVVNLYNSPLEKGEYKGVVIIREDKGVVTMKML
jgi:hypothetical protein